jgi:magnesium-transporting ATPase (P-type)
MSVIVRHDGVIKMYVKGADSIIISRLSKQQPQPFLKPIQDRLDFFAKKGLRTLCLGLKVLREDEYQEFNR